MIYMSREIVKKIGLKTGDNVEGIITSPKNQKQHFALQKVLSVHNKPIKELMHRMNFDNLTPIHPESKFELGGDEKMQSKVLELKSKTDYSMRVIDMVAPIGKGQRALIVAPPKTGKTMMLKNIAQSIQKGNKDIHLMVLLVDERPEEVTEMTRAIDEVIGSNFDEPAIRHIQVAKIVLKKRKDW